MVQAAILLHFLGCMRALEDGAYCCGSMLQWERCFAFPADIHYVVTVALKIAMTYLYHAREAPTTASSRYLGASSGGQRGRGLVRRLLGEIVYQ